MYKKGVKDTKRIVRAMTSAMSLYARLERSDVAIQWCILDCFTFVRNDGREVHNDKVLKPLPLVTLMRPQNRFKRAHFARKQKFFGKRR